MNTQRTKIKISIGIIVFFSIWATLPTFIGAANSPSFELSAVQDRVTSGQYVDVVLQGTGLSQLYAFEAEISFNSSVLQSEKATSIANGYSGSQSIGDGRSLVYFTKLGQKSENGAAQLLTLRFKAISSGEVTITLHRIDMESIDKQRERLEPASVVTVQVVAAPASVEETTPNRELSLATRTSGDSNGHASFTLQTSAFKQAIQRLQAASPALRIPLDTNNEQSISLSSEVRLLMNAAHTHPGTELLIVLNDQIAYRLPITLFQEERLAEISELDREALASSNIVIHIEKVVPPANELELVSDPYRFSIGIKRDNGQNLLLPSFGNLFISRSFRLNPTTDIATLTGAVWNETSGQWDFVPTRFHNEDGTLVAELRRNGNSVYAVVRHIKTFEDLSGHWARDHVEKLASKLLVKGKTEQTFSPDDNVTRAEFVALLVRSIGLVDLDEESGYVDVSKDKWFSGSISAATKAGLVNGYKDQTFRPDEPITREQIAVILDHARNMYDLTSTTRLSDEGIASNFTDQSMISDWSLESIARIVHMGLMKGMSADTFGPQIYATRAQSVIVIERLLLRAGWLQ